MDDGRVHYHGISFVGVLTIVFVILKLCNVIAWSWLWVLAPLWIPGAFTFLLIVIVILWTLITS